MQNLSQTNRKLIFAQVFALQEEEKHSARRGFWLWLNNTHIMQIYYLVVFNMFIKLNTILTLGYHTSFY